jgi:hypothetical protein
LTIPFPIVFATAVEKKAPATFIKAARRTACKGVSTLVDTTVAMAFAESFQPLLISNRRVIPMTRIMVVSSMLENYAFEDICDVLTIIQCFFEMLVNFLPLDHQYRVFYIIKQFCQGGSENTVSLILKPVYFNTVFLNV